MLRLINLVILTFSIFASLITISSTAQPVYAADPTCAKNAPAFLRFDPSSEIQKGQTLKAIFLPPLTLPEGKWQAYYTFFVSGKTQSVAKFEANNPPASWDIDLGQPGKGTKSLSWNISYKSSRSSIFKTEKCGSYSFTVCDGPCPTPSVIQPGKNPCVGGICNTAIGNIPTGDIREFANKVLRIATGLAGGIALILMVIGAIRVLTSSGDQQKLSAGRDMIVAAVSGLLFLIFSIIILRFIGIDILGL